MRKRAVPCGAVLFELLLVHDILGDKVVRFTSPRMAAQCRRFQKEQDGFSSKVLLGVLQGLARKYKFFLLGCGPDA